MSYQFFKEKSVQILELNNFFDNIENSKILTEISNYIQNGDIYFIIDFSKMEYINSTGLSLLINILTKARNAGGEVIISNLSENISKVLLITRIENLFEITQNNEEALEKFSALINANS
jgi:anti-sigma B factor antagonist